MNINVDEILMVIVAFLIGWFLRTMIKGELVEGLFECVSDKNQDLKPIVCQDSTFSKVTVLNSKAIKDNDGEPDCNEMCLKTALLGMAQKFKPPSISAIVLTEEDGTCAELGYPKYKSSCSVDVSEFGQPEVKNNIYIEDKSSLCGKKLECNKVNVDLTDASSRGMCLGSSQTGVGKNCEIKIKDDPTHEPEVEACKILMDDSCVEHVNSPTACYTCINENKGNWMKPISKGGAGCTKELVDNYSDSKIPCYPTRAGDAPKVEASCVIGDESCSITNAECSKNHCNNNGTCNGEKTEPFKGTCICDSKWSGVACSIPCVKDLHACEVNAKDPKGNPKNQCCSGSTCISPFNAKFGICSPFNQSTVNHRSQKPSN